MIIETSLLALSCAVFALGLAGCLRRRGHVALMILSGTVSVLASILVLVAAHAFHADLALPLSAVSLVLAALAHAGVAAALMICLYRRRGVLALRRINAPRG
ncbi:MAG: NADH-quinone oxidoreductase subunit K [Pseudomonadota bacterium]